MCDAVIHCTSFHSPIALRSTSYSRHLHPSVRAHVCLPMRCSMLLHSVMHHHVRRPVHTPACYDSCGQQLNGCISVSAMFIIKKMLTIAICHDENKQLWVIARDIIAIYNEIKRAAKQCITTSVEPAKIRVSSSRPHASR